MTEAKLKPRPSAAPRIPAASRPASHRRAQAALDLDTSTALRRGDLTAASACAERICRLNRSSHWYPADASQPISSMPWPTPMLSRGKVWHDLEQLKYLSSRGAIPKALSRRIESYQQVRDRMGDRSFARRPLDERERELIGDVYGRVVTRAIAARERAALSPSWNRDRVEAAYVTHPIGIVVIDDFLTSEALNSLRRFCIESTIWFENRYSYGRLGAFFRDGFNCPLMIQIAEELQAALPRIIAGQPLQQMWAFKNEPYQPTTLPHADFAVVNVNFWLTPERANLDPSSGGMIIYDTPTPAEWDFEMYNTRGDLIADHLLRHGARAVTIPYRANRAIIFNSRYFHKTDELNFSRSYEDRRINVTLLYGRHDGAHRA
jgi:hypothetical protein